MSSGEKKGFWMWFNLPIMYTYYKKKRFGFNTIEILKKKNELLVY